MARTALVIKTQKRKQTAEKQKKAGKKVEFSTKIYNRCKLCGRKFGYMRRFDMCRICFRELAKEGKIPGVKKSSW
jgi:small subunit ribosomal protein S14